MFLWALSAILTNAQTQGGGCMNLWFTTSQSVAQVKTLTCNWCLKWDNHVEFSPLPVESVISKIHNVRNDLNFQDTAENWRTSRWCWKTLQCYFFQRVHIWIYKQRYQTRSLSTVVTFLKNTFSQWQAKQQCTCRFLWGLNGMIKFIEYLHGIT